MTLIKERLTIGADEKFLGIASELFAALAFAHSDKSDGETVEAFGKAVAIARRFVAAADVLRKQGQGYEP
jgi:hypothetical protein